MTTKCTKCSEPAVNVPMTLCNTHTDELRALSRVEANLRRRNTEHRLFGEELDVQKLDNLDINGVDTRDYPDFCDAYISSGYYGDTELTDQQLEYINDNYQDLIYEEVIDRLY